MRRDITVTRNLAIVAIIIAVLSQIALAVRTMQNAGMGFFEYVQLSDFGLWLAMWSYNPAWVLISTGLFLGGGFTFFFSVRP